MDPTARDGQMLTISQNDLDALEFFGHSVAPVTTLSGDTMALTTGIPQFSSIVAPSNGNCVLSGLQFTITVPANATQLKIELHGIQDTDLYARFNQRLAVQNNTLLADASSEGDTGSESITLTRTTTPALQTGTYFIGTSNCGLAATPFNITASTLSEVLSSVILRGVNFDASAPVMVLKTTGLVAPADLEINGVIVSPPIKVKVKSDAKAKVVATAAELGLHAGANTVRLRINGAFTNPVTLNQ
jgi:hypothetical protein